MVENHACCHLFQMFASNMHQNEWFQVWFFLNFLGRGSPSSLPRPLPIFFSGFALGSDFALNSQALRALNSGFALNFWLENFCRLYLEHDIYYPRPRSSSPNFMGYLPRHDHKFVCDWVFQENAWGIRHQGYEASLLIWHDSILCFCNHNLFGSPE